VNILLKQQRADELRRQFADLFVHRHELEAQRKAQADGAAEQIKRLDADLELLARAVADAERALRMAT
jgi:hypothetical protein